MHPQKSKLQSQLTQSDKIQLDEGYRLVSTPPEGYQLISASQARKTLTFVGVVVLFVPTFVLMQLMFKRRHYQAENGMVYWVASLSFTSLFIICLALGILYVWKRVGLEVLAHEFP